MPARALHRHSVPVVEDDGTRRYPNEMHTTGRLLLALLLLAAFSDPLPAADDALPDFSSLSLQELSMVKVTSVSRKQQKLSQVAAAVYVITQEEIHRSGMTTVADLLRLAPGLSVARLDASTWAVTSRGFNGRFANKLLVLVDGRSIYSPIFSGVYWDMNMPPLDNIERIEVIRGAGAAVWGANAVSGVINIITRSAKETTGVEVTASAGTRNRGAVEVQAGNRLGRGAYYRTYLGATDYAALQTANGNSAHDSWSDMQAGFRIDGTTRRGEWQLEGDLFHNRRDEVSDLPIPENHFSSDPRDGVGTANSGDLTFEWRRRISETSDVRVNASYDYINRPELGFAKVAAGTGSLEGQYHFRLRKYHDVSLGLGDRVVSDDVRGLGLMSFVPATMTYQTASAFAQDEIHLLEDRVLLTAGIKIEHDILGGWQTQPAASALWAPNKKHSGWVSASRAVRTPAFCERAADMEVVGMPASPATFGLPVVSTANGTGSFRAEVSKDYEIGYRALISPAFSIDLTGFYTRFEDLRSATPGYMSLVLGQQPYILLPYYLTNFAQGHSAGGEIAVTYHPVARWKVATSYSYLHLAQVLSADALAGTTPGADNSVPAHQLKLQSYWNVSKSLQLDAHVFYNSRFESTGDLQGVTTIPQHLRIDLRLGWRVNPRWEASLVAQDLGTGKNLELTPEALEPASYTSRGFYVKSTWRF